MRFYTLSVVVILGFVAYRLARLIAHDKIAEPFRARCTPRRRSGPSRALAEHADDLPVLSVRMVRYSWGRLVRVDDRPDLARLGRVPARHPRRRRRRRDPFRR